MEGGTYGADMEQGVEGGAFSPLPRAEQTSLRTDSLATQPFWTNATMFTLNHIIQH
jgi:hypothetical protein